MEAGGFEVGRDAQSLKRGLRFRDLNELQGFLAGVDQLGKLRLVEAVGVDPVSLCVAVTTRYFDRVIERRGVLALALVLKDREQYISARNRLYQRIWNSAVGSVFIATGTHGLLAFESFADAVLCA